MIFPSFFLFLVVLWCGLNQDFLWYESYFTACDEYEAKMKKIYIVKIKLGYSLLINFGFEPLEKYTNKNFPLF